MKLLKFSAEGGGLEKLWRSLKYENIYLNDYAPAILLGTKNVYLCYILKTFFWRLDDV